jgi:hypothetical protein
MKSSSTTDDELSIARRGMLVDLRSAKVSLWCSVVTRRSVPRVGSFGEFLELGGELKAVLVLHLLV